MPGGLATKTRVAEKQCQTWPITWSNAVIGGQWPVGIRVERLKPGFEGTKSLQSRSKPRILSMVLRWTWRPARASWSKRLSLRALSNGTQKVPLPKPKCQPIHTIPLPSCNLACEMGMPNMAQKARTRQENRAMTSSSCAKRKSST